jgi:hypothetical protein
MWENDSCGKVIYMDDVQGPEKVKNTCVIAMHAGTMARGFSVQAYRRDGLDLAKKKSLSLLGTLPWPSIL